MRKSVYVHQQHQQQVQDLKKLSQGVHEWLSNELHLEHNNNPSQNLLLSISQLRTLCRGNMTDVWSFLINNIHDAKKVDLVKKNVLLYGKQQIDNQIMQEKEKRDLMNKINEVKRRIAHVRDHEIQSVDYEVEQIKSEMRKNTGRQVNRDKQERECEERIVLLKGYEEKCHQTNQVLSEFNFKLKSTIVPMNQLQQMEQDDEDIVMSEASYDRNPIDSDSSVVKSVSEAYQLMIDRYEQQMKSRYTDINEESIRSTIANITRSDSKELLRILVNLTKKDTKRVKLHLTDLSVNRDKEYLTTSYERLSGQSADLMCDTRKLLDDRRNEHIAQFLETERNLNTANEFNLKLDQQMIALQIEFSRTGYSRNRFASELLDAELKFAALSAANNQLEKRIEHLSTIRDQHRALIHVLEDKTKKIQSFRQQLDDKQNSILQHSEDNSNMHMILQGRQQDILNYVQTNLSTSGSSLIVEVPVQVDQLKNTVSKEMRLFNKIPWSKISPDTDKQKELLQQELFQKVTERGLQSQSKTLLPDYKTVDSILTYISDVQNEQHQQELNVSLNRYHLQQIEQERQNGVMASSDHVASVIEKCSRQDYEQRDSWIPQIQEYISLCDVLQLECDEVRQLGNEWWEKPAMRLNWKDILPNGEEVSL